MMPSPCKHDPLELHRELDTSSKSYQELEVHVQSCESCQATVAELEELDSWNESHWKALDPEPMTIPDPNVALQKFHERRSPQPSPHDGWSQWLPFGAIASTMAVIVLMIWLGPLGESNRVPKRAPEHVMKGSSLDVVMLHARARPNKPRVNFSFTQQTQQGSVLHPGDLVQFVVTAKQPTHLMVLSVNQKGEVFVYAPFKGKTSLLVEPGKSTFPRSAAFELDDVLGWERFFVVSSSKAFALQQIQSKLKTIAKTSGTSLQASPTLPKPMQVFSTFIHKRSTAVAPR